MYTGNFVNTWGYIYIGRDGDTDGQREIRRAKDGWTDRRKTCSHMEGRVVVFGSQMEGGGL